ncbi:unnamed protein product (macronuclear) [Paramecium tetraurelia]|uniref:Uncharacterized protein n=1 Tax=Paramecium tetraurelia TaxID=5888 RepID=A0CDL1_PARTE|nr:uncharacterized protein GSPATT00007089001 [Paramecium tetraurelia]CAK68878.1 unnamed protein product [Paramecium tetraurelia]|eukprot:XP_001436275.1 hypothetical protein (macronuclear) [Paramecium tetraurelia strain d4-2]
MDNQNLFQFKTSFTPSSPLKTRPLPSPSLDSLEEFNLNDLESDSQSSRKSSTQKFDKQVLVIDYLIEKLRDYE